MRLRNWAVGFVIGTAAGRWLNKRRPAYREPANDLIVEGVRLAMFCEQAEQLDEMIRRGISAARTSQPMAERLTDIHSAYRSLLEQAPNGRIALHIMEQPRPTHLRAL